MANEDNIKVRYSDEELAEFKVIVEEKLKEALAEYNEIRERMRHGDNDDRDTAPMFKNMEDGAKPFPVKNSVLRPRASRSSSRVCRVHWFVLRTRPMASAASLISLFLRSVCVQCLMLRSA